MRKEIIKTLVDYKTGDTEIHVEGINDSYAFFKNGKWLIHGTFDLNSEGFIYHLNAPAKSLKYLPKDLPIRSSVLDFDDSLLEEKVGNITDSFETVKDLYNCAENVLRNLDQDDFSFGEILKKNLWQNQEAIDYIVEAIFYGCTGEHFSTVADWIAEDIIESPYGYQCLFENEVK